MDLKKLNKFEYISFDMYDTLIKRNIHNPKDIFRLVEVEFNKKYNANISNFYELRIESEKNLRENSTNELKLSDIYEYMKKYYSQKICNNLMQIEENLEIELSQKNYNPKVLDIYNWALKNKHIIISSDM